MGHQYSEDNRGYPGSSRRGYPPRDDRDGRMYDDRSRSRSPADFSRSPPRGPSDHRYDYSNRDSRSYRNDHDEYRHRSSRSPRRGRQSYRDRDREGYRSPGYSRSRSRSGGRHFNQQSREIMMEGFPADMTENDIAIELRDAYHVADLDDIRVIRDRHTKASRQLGFLRFKTLDESIAFLEQNRPFIHFYGPTGERSTKVRIAYSREREDRARVKAEGDWTCRMCAVINFATRAKCFRCNAPRPELPPTAPGVPVEKVINNGDNDAAPDNQPSQFLLFRGLESSVTEELLAKGVAKLYRPSSSTDGASQKKAGKVASTTGDANLGAREGSIRRVLLVRDRQTNESWRYGFAEFATVTDAQAALTRLHSFDKFTISSRQVMVSYIHAGVFVPVLVPSPALDRFTFSPLNNPSLKLMYWDDAAYLTELMVSEESPSQASEKPVGQQDKTTKETEKVKKRKADAAASDKAKKLAVPSQLQFWSNRHAELHGISKDDENSDAGENANASSDAVQSYADPNRHCCYLCLRMFRDAAHVNRHERLSQLHRANLQNEECVSRGTWKLVKHGIIPPPPEYRDRAKERRQAFGRASAKNPKKKPDPKEEEPVQTNSKGASLLSKMGWSEGSGLGAQGTGVTAPIATEIYAQGVGLGAQGSKLGDAVEEAGRNTRGRYDEFLEKTRENARQRYDQMNQ